MNRLMILNPMAAIRGQVIYNRVGDAFVAGAKSQMIENLKQKMTSGVAHFLFLKKDGSIREAWGTISSSLANKHINGRGESRENFATTAYFDVEAGAWRSFRWESLIKVF